MILSFADYKQIAKLLKTKKFAAVVETDTVMGLISLNPKLIYTIKNRQPQKKLIFFISSINQIPNFPSQYKKIITPYWPGSLTIIYNNISYRIPNHKKLINLIKLTGPIYSSSANISGCNPCIDYLDSEKIFKKHFSQIIFVKGKNLTNKPSTIIDLDKLKIVREGSINGKEILDKLMIKKNKKYNDDSTMEKANKQTVFIGSDHAGFLMKEAIKEHFKNEFQFTDVGTFNNNSIDYPLIAFKLGENVVSNNSMGILICGTGFGVNIAVNKVKGIRAVDITNPKIAHLAREHNNANVICLSGRFTSKRKNYKIINNFFKSKFDLTNQKNVRHLKRIKEISEYERRK